MQAGGGSSPHLLVASPTHLQHEVPVIDVGSVVIAQTLAQSDPVSGRELLSERVRQFHNQHTIHQTAQAHPNNPNSKHPNIHNFRHVHHQEVDPLEPQKPVAPVATRALAGAEELVLNNTDPACQVEEEAPEQPPDEPETEVDFNLTPRGVASAEVSALPTARSVLSRGSDLGYVMISEGGIGGLGLGDGDRTSYGAKDGHGHHGQASHASTGSMRLVSPNLRSLPPCFSLFEAKPGCNV